MNQLKNTMEEVDVSLTGTVQIYQDNKTLATIKLRYIPINNIEIDLLPNS